MIINTLTLKLDIDVSEFPDEDGFFSAQAVGYEMIHYRRSRSRAILAATREVVEDKLKE